MNCVKGYLFKFYKYIVISYIVVWKTLGPFGSGVLEGRGEEVR
jgi:hypothetical protein